MSMSQEEIESLMNGLDFEDDNKSSETEEVAEETPSNENMSEDDINELISQTSDETSQNSEASEEILENNEDVSQPENTSDVSVDDVLNNIEEVNIEETPSTEIKDESSDDNNSTVDDIDSLLASIDGVTDDEANVEEVLNETIKESEISNNEEIESSNDIDSKINNGVFPFPVEQDTKVVNQLSQVANDSEEKASRIFDVLSNILDYNNNIQNDVNELSKFNDKQVAMLSALSTKFPNIDAFTVNLEESKKMGDFISDVNDKLNNGNMEIFEAMELMQYHDINRQKIERVMSVIRKLTVYLNNLFEDDGNRQEVAVAKHIHGDNDTDDLMDDSDLESLIAEFNK